MKGIWKWLVVHKKAFRPSRYMGYAAWCVLMVFCCVDKAIADDDSRWTYPEITEWKLTGVETNGTDYLVAGSDATLRITLKGCHLDWFYYWDWHDSRKRIEFKCVKLFVDGLDELIDNPACHQVVYVFGKDDDDDDGDVAFEDDPLVGDDPFVSGMVVHVSDDLPAESISVQGSNVVITLKVPLQTGMGMHGKFELFPYVTSTVIKQYKTSSAGEYWYDEEPESWWSNAEDLYVERSIFFDKYGQDFPEEGPNWFVYWKEDGAVPGLLYGEKYRYSNVAGAVSIGHIGELEKVLLLGNDKNTWGEAERDLKTGHVTGHVILHALASEEHYFKYYPTLEAGGIEFCRPWVYGIYTVANVIAHEQKHIELYLSYVSDLESKGIEYPPQDREGCLRVKEMNSDYDYDSVFSIDSLLDKIRFRAKIAGFPFGSIGFPFGSMVRTNDDYMTDNKEMEINATIGSLEGFKLDRDKVDTFDLGTKRKNPSYSRYGDNEFMAMLAGYIANRDEGTAIEANDWAYPGHQSWLPDNVIRKPTVNSGIVVQSLTRTTPLCTPTAETEVQIKEPFMASNGVIMAVNGDTIPRGEDDFVRYQLSFDVTGSMMVRFVGYLIDSGSNVVSCAGTTVDLTANDNSCELAFPTNEIVRSGFKGPYTLSGMIVYRVNGGDLICEGIWREIETDWVEIARPTVNGENEGFPEVESDADVGNALSGTESTLRENITTKEEYDAFRSWAQSVKRADGSTAGVQTVKESTRAWLSFALGTDTLIGKDITSDDVHIVSFQMEGGSDEMISSSSRSPTFIFEVAIDGVKIGSGVVAEEILKSNLKKVLAVEGSAQLDATTFSSDNIEIVFEPPVDGRARFMATTPSRLDNTFFMRVKVK